MTLTVRVVRQQIWARALSIPDGAGGQLTVIWVAAREMHPPAGCKAVQWHLLTHRIASDFAAVVELIDWYRCRWGIEIFFNVLKNGCRVEALQLDNLAKLQFALALYIFLAFF